MPGVVTLLERQERYLVLHAAATVALTIRFREGRRHATDIALQAAFPMHSAHDWQRLLAVKLERQAYRLLRRAGRALQRRARLQQPPSPLRPKGKVGAR